MNSNRKRTVFAGSLYIVGTVAGILSLSTVVDSTDYLIKTSANANQVLSSSIVAGLLEQIKRKK